MTSNRASQIHAMLATQAADYLVREIKNHREAELPAWGPQRWVGAKVYDAITTHIASSAPGLIKQIISDMGAMTVDELLELCGHA